LVSFGTIVIIGGGLLFLFAGGGKFIAPAISKTKNALTQGKDLLRDTASDIQNKTRERDSAG